MGLLLLLYAISMALATFVENDYGTPVAKALIYNSWWFEVLMIFLILNFVGNIVRYKLYMRQKWPLLVFHLAFIVIFAGGAVTRYISFEGSMHIREGESSNEIISDASFIKVQVKDSLKQLVYDDFPVLLTSQNVPFYLKPFRKSYSKEYDFMGRSLNLKVIDFIPRAQDSVVFSRSGKSILHLVTLVNGNRVNKYINSGSVQLINNIPVSYNKDEPGAVNISDKKGGLTISSPINGTYTIMSSQTKGGISGTGEQQVFNLRSLYNIGGLTFVVPQLPQTGEIRHFEGDKRTNENDPDLLRLALKVGDAIDTVVLYGGRGITGLTHQAQVGGLTVSLGYGSKIYYTSFMLNLQRFKMEKYPGSNSPASYSSDVKVIDRGSESPYTIYMNHVLDHSGYRFFQSSFDPDEKGTILSVNHDYTGTTLTYIGYSLLFSGMFLIFFWKGTRFSKLNNQLKMLSLKKPAVLLLLVLLTSACFGQKIDTHGPSEGNALQKEENQHTHTEDRDTSRVSTPFNLIRKDAKSFADSVNINKEHAARFGSLLVQGFDGRIEPVNTLALEILRKLYHKDQFYRLDANQFLLSFSTQPFLWIQVPLIKISSKGGKDLLQTVKADSAGYTSLIDLLELSNDGQPHFVLESEYQKAFAKKSADQNNYDKEVIEINDKVQVMQLLITGQYLRVLPVINDPNNTWVASSGEDTHLPQDKQNTFAAYIKEVIDAEASSQWGRADQALSNLKAFQGEAGKKVTPSEAKIKWEIRYNSWNVFFKLMIVYAILGTIILLLAFGKLFSDSKLLSRTILLLLVAVTASALIQAAGLAVRWYISGHEPWSNGYEAVMFISWIGIVAGLLLYRNSNAFIPAAGCLIAVILMGFAHGGSQMNPQITPLVPVLKSYWLMIHVAIITSSYGFFGLGALIGMVVLLLNIINNKNIHQKVNNSINELTIVNEMSLTVGLFLLTVGTFLGGIWANESWGRYWSWDPKETWAFISIIVYAFVLHVRLIPKMKSKFLFNLLSLISFSSVIMTYFGVNYYLSGLHSYAKGDPVPIPGWVYITTLTITIISILSYISYRRTLKSGILMETVNKNSEGMKAASFPNIS